MSLQVPTLVLNQIVQPIVQPTVQPLLQEEPKQFIILHTKDLDKEDIDTLESYGKLVQYSSKVEGSRPLSELKFDYITIDLRNKKDRVYLDSQDIGAFNVICVISFIEKFDSFIEDLACANTITTFPPRQHHKEDYDALLLRKATESPSKCLSLINFASNFFESLKKK